MFNRLHELGTNKRWLAAMALLPFCVFRTDHEAAPQAGTIAQAEYGTIQGTVFREGSSDPIADVQITVNGANQFFFDFLGPGATPQQVRALAQSFLDEAKRGSVLIPAELLIAAQEAAQGNSAAARKSAPLTATTDSAGRFRIDNVPAGTASVRAQLRGYFAPPTNGLSAPSNEQKVDVEPRKTAEMRIPLVQGGTITGRVSNVTGKVMTDLPIQVLRSGYRNGQIALQFADMKISDDRGVFRSSPLPPGDYYVLANPAQSYSKAIATNPTEVSIPTLYPDALDVDAALTVSLRAGADSLNIDIRVRSAPAAKVSGKVTTSLPSGPVIGQRGQSRPSTAALAMMSRTSLASAELEGVVLGPPNITAKPDGTFEILNVPPGIYDVFARLPVAANFGWGPGNPPARATTPWAIGRATVEVNGSDVDGLQVVVDPGVDLKGRLVVDGKPAEGAFGISLVPDNNATNVNDGQMTQIYSQIAQYQPAIAPDGSFLFPRLPEGPYKFRTSFNSGANSPAATPLPESAYVSDIRQSAASVYESGILIGRSVPNPIEVLVNTNGSRIEGIVTGADGKPAPGMLVVLVPVAERRSNVESFQTVTSDASGRFSILRIPPGQYTLFASKNIQFGAFQNSMVFAKYAGYGAAVSISGGTASTIELKTIPNE